MRGIGHQHDEESDDEGPRSAEARHLIRNVIADRGLLFDHFVGIAHGAHAHQLLRAVILLAEHGQHVHAGMRLAFQQHHDVVAVHLDADGLFGSQALVWCGVWSSMEAKPKNSPTAG